MAQDTKEYMGHLIKADHALVSATVRTLRVAKMPRRRHFTKCGKWCVNPTTLVAECQALHEQMHGLNSMQPPDACALCMESIESPASRTSFRSHSFRYQDPPHIKALIAQRRELLGEEAHQKAAEIVHARRCCKQECLAEVLTRARHGDFAAISYMKRRQSMGHTHTSYLLRAGGEHKALSDLRSFYQAKYTCERLHDSALSVEMVSAHAVHTVPGEFTFEEVSGVLFNMKRGNSCGPDGVSYELLQGLHQTSLGPSLDSLFNAVLYARQRIPASWFEGQLTFLPKVAKPSCPKDLRPIVLSPTTGKLFTKLLLMGIRPTCPPIKCGQLCAQQGSQALDGSLSLQRLIHLSNRWGLPLMATKLDISAAFDSLHHSTVARHFLQCRPSREALLLQTIVAGTSIKLGMCGDSWCQKLHQGLQGSSYSAEIFASVLGSHVSLLLPTWSQLNATWLQGLHLILYADDILLLATSQEEMRQKF